MLKNEFISVQDHVREVDATLSIIHTSTLTWNSIKYRVVGRTNKKLYIASSPDLFGREPGLVTSVDDLLETMQILVFNEDEVVHYIGGGNYAIECDFTFYHVDKQHINFLIEVENVTFSERKLASYVSQ